MKFALTIPPGEFEKTLGAKEVMRRAKSAMHVILEDAAGYLQEATPVGVTGIAAKGWEKNMTVRVTRTSVVAVAENVQPYLYYVVHGTDPARSNPGRYLIPWVSKKLTIPQQYKLARLAGMSESSARSALQRSSVKFQANSLTVSVAFIIGRARMKRGSEPNDFVTPIIDRNRAKWERVLQKALFN